MPSRILKTPRRIVAARCDETLFDQLARAASTNGRSVSGKCATACSARSPQTRQDASAPPLKHRARRTETAAPR